MWGEVLKQAIRLLPELRRLMPLLERYLSPEAKRAEEARISAILAAAQDARDAAYGAAGVVAQNTAQWTRAHAELSARLESCEQRVRDAVSEIRSAAEQQSLLTKQMAALLLWIKLLAAVVVALLIAIIVLAVRH
jgi:chromosome segregation ATPase